MCTVRRALLLLGLLVCAVAAWADEAKPYSEGAVVSVGYVRTKYGMFDEYMKFLDGPYKRLMEEQKKSGIILDYGVYRASPRNPHEPDIILTIVFKNWAALDGLNDKLDALEKKEFGSLDASNKAAVDRGQIREVLGGQMIQELKLK
jgi:hypothetical protein